MIGFTDRLKPANEPAEYIKFENLKSGSGRTFTIRHLIYSWVGNHFFNTRLRRNYMGEGGLYFIHTNILISNNPCLNYPLRYQAIEDNNYILYNSVWEPVCAIRILLVGYFSDKLNRYLHLTIP